MNENTKNRQNRYFVMVFKSIFRARLILKKEPKSDFRFFVEIGLARKMGLKTITKYRFWRFLYFHSSPFVQFLYAFVAIASLISLYLSSSLFFFASCSTTSLCVSRTKASVISVFIRAFPAFAIFRSFFFRKLDFWYKNRDFGQKSPKHREPASPRSCWCTLIMGMRSGILTGRL